MCVSFGDIYIHMYTIYIHTYVCICVANAPQHYPLFYLQTFVNITLFRFVRQYSYVITEHRDIPITNAVLTPVNSNPRGSIYAESSNIKKSHLGRQRKMLVFLILFSVCLGGSVWALAFNSSTRAN